MAACYVATDAFSQLIDQLAGVFEILVCDGLAVAVLISILCCCWLSLDDVLRQSICLSGLGSSANARCTLGVG